MKSFYEMWSLLEQTPNVAPQAQSVPQMQGTPQMQSNTQKNFIGVGADPEEDTKLKSLLGKNYEQFVKELQGNINDPKFLSFLKAGLQDGNSPQDDMVRFSNINVPCTNLIPTQNEIDVDKSIGYPLTKTDAQTILSYLNGGVFAPGGAIVTCGGGKYIIDGHHRWSQLYCMNPKAQIKAIDMTAFSDPVSALKVVQLSIASTQGKIVVQKVDKANMLNMNEQQIKDYIAKNMSDNAKQAFSQIAQGQDPIAYAQQYIWNNTMSMQQNNKPISGASKRDFMPQTDSGGQFASELQSGKVNWTQDQQKQVSNS